MIDEQGWILRNCIIWHKPNAMPSSVKDRLSNTYEFIFHFVKSPDYYYDLDAIREPPKEENIACSQRGFTEEGNKEPYKINNPNRNRFNLISQRVQSNIQHFRQKGSGGHYDYGGLDSKEGSHSHPKGKNPGDTIRIHSLRRKSWMAEPGHKFTIKRYGLMNKEKSKEIFGK